MSTIIEIDNIRHMLVEDIENGDNCCICSLNELCPKIRDQHLASNALCVIFEDFDHHFIELDRGI